VSMNFFSPTYETNLMFSPIASPFPLAIRLSG
jgi:hypothetical protein